MIKRLFIMLFGVLGAVTAAAQAQQSAQASMQVTVTVVEGSQMQLSQPDKILVKQDEQTSLGQLTIGNKKEANIQVHTNPEITLLAANGARMDMDVQTRWEGNGNERRLTLRGSARSQTLSKGDYKGELKTTVAYN